MVFVGGKSGYVKVWWNRWSGGIHREEDTDSSETWNEVFTVMYDFQPFESSGFMSMISY